MNRILLPLLFLFTTLANGQAIPDVSAYKTEKEKLKALARSCDSLFKIPDIASIRSISNYVLAKPETDDYNRSLFYFYLAAAYEGDIDADSCIKTYEYSIAFGRKANSPKRVRNALDRLLYIYSNTPGYNRQSEATVKELLGIIDTTRNEAEKAGLYGNISTYYNIRGEYTKQADYALKSIAILKKLVDSGVEKDREVVVVNLMNLGGMYLGNDQVEKGLYYTREAKKYIVGTIFFLSHYYKQMADGLLLNERPDQARIYYDSLTAMLSSPEVTGTLFRDRIYSDLAFSDYYLRHSKPDSAFLYADRANTLGEKWADEFARVQINYMNGKVYFEKKEYAKALEQLLAIEQGAAETDPKVHVALLQIISRAYAAIGEHRKAFLYYEKYAPLRDSLYVQASERSIAEAEAQFQNREKQQQIDLKNLQIEDARKQRLWLIGGLALMALSLGLLAVIYRNNKRNALVLDKKNSELEEAIAALEEANRTKAKLFGIISHDLRSPISQVYQFLKLHQMNPDLLSDQQRSELSRRIQTATGSLLETMEDLLLWSKTQMNEFQAVIQPVEVAPVVLHCIDLLRLNLDAKNLTTEVAVPENATLLSDPYYLEIILRNLLQNAIKAAPDGSTIQVAFKKESFAVLSVRNSGPLFSQSDYLKVVKDQSSPQGLNGLGLKLVDELSGKSGLTVRFLNDNGDTTRAEIMSGGV